MKRGSQKPGLLTFWGLLAEEWHLRCRLTYKVVKFIVNVRLVEKSLKSRVGRVIEVKVTTHKRTAGISRARSIARAPMRPSHDRDPVPCGAGGNNAEGRGDAELEAVLRREIEPVGLVEAFP